MNKDLYLIGYFEKISVDCFKNKLIQKKIDIVEKYKLHLFTDIYERIREKLIKPLVETNYKKEINFNNLNRVKNTHLFNFCSNKIKKFNMET